VSDCNCDFTGYGITDRLARADRRIACVDRRLGNLQARLYWATCGNAAAEEVPIFEYKDKGVTPKSWKTGVEIEAHRHSVRVDFAWWQSKSGEYGVYSIKVPYEANPLPCEVESQSYQPGETSATIDLRIVQGVPTYG
jgi:hypothetical protein